MVLREGKCTKKFSQCISTRPRGGRRKLGELVQKRSTLGVVARLLRKKGENICKGAWREGVGDLRSRALGKKGTSTQNSIQRLSRELVARLREGEQENTYYKRFQAREKKEKKGGKRGEKGPGS